MRAEVTRVGEPRSLLTIEPAKKPIGQECRDAEFGRTFRFTPQRLLRIEWHVEFVLAKVLDPLLMLIALLGNEQLTIETRKHTLERIESPIVWAVGIAWIRRLIGVSEQHRVESGSASEQGNVVETSVERCAVGHDPMIHLVHARVQAGSAG